MEYRQTDLHTLQLSADSIASRRNSTNCTSDVATSSYELGDGIDDLAVGAPDKDFEGSGAGAGVVFLRQFGDDSGSIDTMMLAMSQKPASSNHAGDHIGQMLAVVRSLIWRLALQSAGKAFFRVSAVCSSGNNRRACE